MGDEVAVEVVLKLVVGGPVLGGTVGDVVPDPGMLVVVVLLVLVVLVVGGTA